MSLKNKLKFAAIYISVCCAGVTLPQIILNEVYSGKEIKPNGYFCEHKKGIFPLTPYKGSAFSGIYDTKFNEFSGNLTIFSSVFPAMFGERQKYCSIDDLNGDFEPDKFYQEGVKLYRKDNPEFFKNTVDPIWEENMKKLKVSEAHKKWMENYGKDLLK